MKRFVNRKREKVLAEVDFGLKNGYNVVVKREFFKEYRR